MEEITARLKKIRQTTGLSQGEFARQMGIKQSTWSNIEVGLNPCADRHVNLVCLTYNVRKEWLLDGQGEMFGQNPPNSQFGAISEEEGRPLPPEVTELVTIFQELVPLNQKAVLDFLETTLQSQRNTIKAINKSKDSD